MHDGITTLQRMWALLTLSKHVTRPPHPTITHPWALRSPTKICCCNSNNLHRQHLCAQDRKGNSWNPPECRRTPRWQHGSGPIPLPHDGICRNSWDSLEAARDPHCQCYDCQRQEHDRWKNMQSHSDHHVQIDKMMVHSHLAREATYKEEWDWCTTTLAGSDRNCTLDGEHRRPKLNASSFLPPSSFNTLNNVLLPPQ